MVLIGRVCNGQNDLRHIRRHRGWRSELQRLRRQRISGGKQAYQVCNETGIIMEMIVPLGSKVPPA